MTTGSGDARNIARLAGECQRSWPLLQFHELNACLQLDIAPTTNDPIGGISVTRAGRSAVGTFHTPFYAQNLIIKTIPLLKWLSGSVSGFTPEPVQVPTERNQRGGRYR